MHPSHPSQPYATPTPMAFAPSPRRRAPLIAALAVGVVFGGGGVGTAWILFGSDGGSGSDAAADAIAACGALDRLDESNSAAEGAAGDISIRQWAAAQLLAESAAAGDPTYKPLSTALANSRTYFDETLDVGGEVKAELTKARRICDDL
jgi:hypothetical protein